MTTIPKIAHFIYGLDNEPFRLTDRIAVRSFHVNNPHWKICFWCPAEPNGPEWQSIRKSTPLTVINIDNPLTWNGNNIPHYQHRADLLRHTILYTMGGAYLDTDTITLAPIPAEWLEHDCVMGREYHGSRLEGPTIGLCNAVMFSRMHSRFQWLWLSEWQRFDGSGWNEFSVQFPWKLREENPGLCHVVDWQILGPIYGDLGRYWDRIEPLTDCVIAHLWRTYSRSRLEALTVEAIRLRRDTYCWHAAEYL